MNVKICALMSMAQAHVFIDGKNPVLFQKEFCMDIELAHGNLRTLLDGCFPVVWPCQWDNENIDYNPNARVHYNNDGQVLTVKVRMLFKGGDKRAYVEELQANGWIMQGDIFNGPYKFLFNT